MYTRMSDESGHCSRGSFDSENKQLSNVSMIAFCVSLNSIIKRNNVTFLQVCHL